MAGPQINTNFGRIRRERLDSVKLGFIGVGNMGEALLRGMIGSGLISSADILASDVDLRKVGTLSSELGITAVGSNQELVKKADRVLLAVKPGAMKGVLSDISADLNEPKWCISIAAGVSTATIESILQTETPVVRVMPNTPAMVGEGMAAVCPGEYANEEHLERTQQIFQAVGKVIVVKETLMDAVTALSGSGPAFVFLIIEALIDAGVQMGLRHEDAAVMAAQTVHGASKMVLRTGEHPAALKNRVTSPAGTTAAGLYELECGGVRAAVMNAVAAAGLRSKEISSE